MRTISLLLELKASSLLLFHAQNTDPSPGYADDLVTYVTTGPRLQQSMEVVHEHGQSLEYSFNVKKSAVIVYYETCTEAARGCDNMLFKLGRERVNKTPNYEHVGVKVCAKGDFRVRTEETVTKAQRVLDMAAPVGTLSDPEHRNLLQLSRFSMGLEIVPGPNQWAMTLELPGKQKNREN